MRCARKAGALRRPLLLLVSTHVRTNEGTSRMTNQNPPEQPNQQQPQAPYQPQAPQAPQAPLPPQAPNFSSPQPPYQPQAPQAPGQPYPQQQAPGQPYPQAPGQPYAQAPGQPYPYGAQPISPKPPTSTLAIVSLILGIIVAPAGIITGHMALSKIKRTGEGGRGLALAGTIIGYVGTALGLLAIAITVVTTLIIGATAATVAGAGLSQYDEYAQSLEDFDSETVTPDSSTGALLDTPEKILAEWTPCDLARELNNPTDAFYDDSEWYASQEALAQLMDPSAESDAIRAYIEHMKTGGSFDLELTAGHVDATAAAEAKFCGQ